MSPNYLVTVIIFLITIAIVGSPIEAIEYQVFDNATGTPGGTRFEEEITIPYTQQTIKLASEFIWKMFKQTDNRKNIDLVTVVVESFTGPAAYAQNGQISVSAEYIQNYNGDVRIEFMGLLYHEATHIWQWNGNGEAPVWMVEGIADYVRLKADFAPLHWPPRGSGHTWEQGYAITAYFLDYCNGLRDGFVAEINSMMKDHYSDDYFVQLLGKGVDQLWNDYKSRFGN